jgi:hypothetical protein
VLVALAGVIAAVLVVIEAVLPSGTPGAPPKAVAAIERLAVTAARSPGDRAKPGQYSHLIERIRQGNETIVIQTWTSHDGLSWRSYTANDGAPPYSVGWGESDTADPSLQFLDSLPTNPTALNHYLRSHVSGSSSTDAAVFTAAGDLLRQGDAPPALRAAVIRVLERTSGITAEAAEDSVGRAAVKITFTDPTRQSGPQSLLFDPKTSSLLEEQDGPNFTATYTYTRPADKVPAVVAAEAGPRPSRPSPATSSSPATASSPTTAA